MLRDILSLDEGCSSGSASHSTWQDPRPDTLPQVASRERTREMIRGQAVLYDERRPSSE